MAIHPRPPFTRAAAAEVASRHGLSAVDAVAVWQLADSVEEAEAIAARFSPLPEPDPLLEALVDAVDKAHPAPDAGADDGLAALLADRVGAPTLNGGRQ